MKKVLTILISLFFIVTGKAQNIGIGTTAPNASSILEIKASNKGLLIPRTSTISRNAIVKPAKGLLLYDTTTNSFWFHNSGTWVQIGASGNGWSLTGNAGTSSINFIGTTDEQSLAFRVNNKQAGRIDNSTFESGTRNTAFGLIALNYNTSGADNSAIGYGTLYSNQTGNQNAALGKYALFNNDANNNTALGFNAMYFNTSGTNNTATGSLALQNNTTGSYLTAIGNAADVDGLNVYNNSTALGYGAIITGSNSIQLGNNAVTQVYAGTGGTTLITGGLKVTGGTPAAGKVLTSDASGVATWQSLSCSYTIGELVAQLGGYIFYLDASGCHGLVCATLDQTSATQWFNGFFAHTNSLESGIGLGKGNTRSIIKFLGNGNYAATACTNYSGTGFSDWYLPSRYELNLMWLYAGQGSSNIAGFAYKSYWSSTENGGGNIWSQNFVDGMQEYTGSGTNNQRYVRAIRAF